MVINNISKIASLILVAQPFLFAQSPHISLRDINNVGPTRLQDERVHDVLIVGPAIMDNVVAKSINVTGSLNFNSLTVEEDAIITGAVEKSSSGQFGHLRIVGTVDLGTADAKGEVHCNKLSTTGPTVLTNTHVTGHSTFAGPLKATACTFNTVTMAPDDIELTDTHATTIVIKKINSQSKFLKWVGKRKNPGSKFLSWAFNAVGYTAAAETQLEVPHAEVLTLSGCTKINGNITFKSKKGHVIIGPDAFVTGTITGATIERR